MELEIIKHKDILFRDLLRGIAVKNVAWPHPIESQVKWIIDKMQSEDMHVFLSEKGKDVAYMTLSPVMGILNGIETAFLGIGCVCSAVKGMGYGNHLMQEVNRYLEKHNAKGLLFCREGVIRFYQKNSWQLIPQEILQIEGSHEGVFTMVYNSEEIHTLIYKDRMF